MPLTPIPGRLVVRGHGGEQVRNTFFDIGARNGAVVFPGTRYTCDMPLLYYATAALISSGYDVLQVHYGYDGEPVAARGGRQEMFTEDVAAAYDALMANRRYWNVALVGKSIGTIAMGRLLNARRLPQGVRLAWLTPMLNAPELGDAIARLPRGSKSIFFTGTADAEHFNPDVAKRIGATDGCRVSVIDGADHSLELHGGVQGSMDVLKRVAGELLDFLGD